METLRDLWNKVQTRWTALDGRQRMLLGSVVGIVLLSTALTVLLANHKKYTVLYTSLDSVMANEIISRLDENRTPYKLENGGRSILVPVDQVHSLRLELAADEGVFTQSKGYEVFDQSKFGMTGFMQQLNYQRALEGELARTISELEEVRAVRVHLVLPSKTMFTEETSGASASVMMRFNPGMQLNPRQVSGISRLVAGSVEHLDISGVTIVDYHGNLLSTQDKEEGGEMSGTQLEVVHSVEESIRRKAQTLLDRVLGPGESVVRVSTEIDFETIERDVESYDPDNSAVRSEEISEELLTEAQEIRNSVTNYEVNRTIERVRKRPGGIKRLTLSVTVGGTYTEGAGEDGARVFVPMPDAELDKLGSLVKNAVGFDVERGDQFHIASIEWNREYIETQKSELQKAEWGALIMQGLKYLGWVLAAVIFFLIWKKTLNSLSTAFENMRVPEPPPAQSAARPQPGAAGRTEASSVVDRLTEVMDANPDETAEALKTMLVNQES
ncbi:MAG: flagellar M-ring protein FliF [Gemmatimonadetes bacterium]|nr:flagellar M-ring protein FliF [Gemmatimonadota bacterium]